MNLMTIFFSVVTVLAHTLFFVVESFLWLNPVVHERVLTKLNVPTNASLYEQAKILEVLFFNQGYYNLFVALGGIAGLALYRKGKIQESITLVTYVCFFALAASLVLAYSTRIGNPGVYIQGLPPLLALVGMYFSVAGSATRE